MLSAGYKTGSVVSVDMDAGVNSVLIRRKLFVREKKKRLKGVTRADCFQMANSLASLLGS